MLPGTVFLLFSHPPFLLLPFPTPCLVVVVVVVVVVVEGIPINKRVHCCAG